MCTEKLSAANATSLTKRFVRYNRPKSSRPPAACVSVQRLWRWTRSAILRGRASFTRTVERALHAQRAAAAAAECEGAGAACAAHAAYVKSLRAPCRVQVRGPQRGWAMRRPGKHALRRWGQVSRGCAQSVLLCTLLGRWSAVHGVRRRIWLPRISRNPKGAALRRSWRAVCSAMRLEARSLAAARRAARHVLRRRRSLPLLTGRRPSLSRSCSLTRPCLRSYTGEYNGGSMSGLGVYTWANGRHGCRVCNAAARADSACRMRDAQHLQGRVEGAPTLRSAPLVA